MNCEAELGVEVGEDRILPQSSIEIMDQRPWIDDLLTVKPRHGARNDIAYSIVLRRRQEACQRNAFNHMGKILIANRSQLKVRPRSDLNGAVGKVKGEIGDGPKLICLNQPSRHSDANQQSVFCLDGMKDAWTEVFPNSWSACLPIDSGGDQFRSEQVHLIKSGKRGAKLKDL